MIVPAVVIVAAVFFFSVAFRLAILLALGYLDPLRGLYCPRGFWGLARHIFQYRCASRADPRHTIEISLRRIRLPVQCRSSLTWLARESSGSWRLPERPEPKTMPAKFHFGFFCSDSRRFCPAFATTGRRRRDQRFFPCPLFSSPRGHPDDLRVHHIARVYSRSVKALNFGSSSPRISCAPRECRCSLTRRVSPS